MTLHHDGSRRAIVFPPNKSDTHTPQGQASMLAVMVYCYARPYLFKSNNYFAIFAHTQITVTLIGASMLRYNEAAREADETSTHSSYTNHDIAIVLIVSNLLVLVVGAIMIAYACVHTSERDYLEAGFASDGKGGYQIDPVATEHGGEDPVRGSEARAGRGGGGGVEMMDSSNFQKRPGVAAGGKGSDIDYAGDDETKTRCVRVTASLQAPAPLHAPAVASASTTHTHAAPSSAVGTGSSVSQAPTGPSAAAASDVPPPITASDGAGDSLFSNPMHAGGVSCVPPPSIQPAPRRRSQQPFFRPIK